MEDVMKPKSYTTTAANMSPFLGPKQLDWLSDTNEFIYRVIYFPLINREDFDIYSDVKSRPGTPPEICLSWLCLKDQYHVSHEVALQNLRFNLAWQLATGTLYRIASIHLDHIGSSAREKGLRQLLEKLEHPTAFPQAHVVLAGDFNAYPDAPEFAALKDYPRYRDAAEKSGGTWHDFGRRQPADKIDYIFVKDLKTGGVKVWTDCENGVYLSDHYPVEVELEP